MPLVSINAFRLCLTNKILHEALVLVKVWNENAQPQSRHLNAGGGLASVRGLPLGGYSR